MDTSSQSQTNHPTADAELDDETTMDEEDEEEASVTENADTAPTENASAAEETHAQALEQMQKKLEAPQAETQPGIVRGLSSTLAENGTLLIVIAKQADGNLLVTIQPAVTDDDAPGTVIPLQVIGTPEEIDTKLIAELAHYVPARALALASGKEIAELTTIASQAQRDAAAKKAADARRPAAKQGALTVTVTPKDAKVTVKDAGGKEQPYAANGKARWLSYGTYKVTASRDGFDDQTVTVTVSNAPQKTEITLKSSEPSLFATTGA